MLQVGATGINQQHVGATWPNYTMEVDLFNVEWDDSMTVNSQREKE
jgi:hypothetical protein